MSHLPLLFADGQPTCLERITQAQLERFIPFMVQCCPRAKAGVPSWWPKDLPFSFPMRPTPPLQKHWISLLRKIVMQCYKHYDCVYILHFCRKLATLGSKSLYYKENGDRTDIIEKTSNKLLVSVKSKNKTYDSVPASPKKLLLRPLPGKSQPIIDDIYLCSHCDAEFTCCKDAVDHEKTVHAPPVEEQSTPQERHLKSLGLLPASKNTLGDGKNVTKARRITSNLSLKKVSSIPICTPLGRLLFANTPELKPQERAKAQEKLEQYCSTDDIVVSETNGIRRSRRVPGSTMARFRQVWSHEYCFNKKQRAERMETIRTGLDQNARRLLRRCRPAKTSIRRLPPLPGNTTIDLKKLKDFIAEEFPNQSILEPPKRPPPPTPPTLTFIPFNLMNPIPRMCAPFNNRPPLAGVPSNRLPTKVVFRCDPMKIQKIAQLPAVTPQPSRTEEPEIIDLCSSDEECEIVAVPENTNKEVYPPLANAPKYGVTAACPKENCPRVTETEMAGIPAKDNQTVLFVQQFCRTRS